MQAVAVRPPEVPDLVPADRCDARCSAQALVRTVSPLGRLLDLCGHHSNVHEPALFAQGFTVIKRLEATA